MTKPPADMLRQRLHHAIEHTRERVALETLSQPGAKPSKKINGWKKS